MQMLFGNKERFEPTYVGSKRSFFRPNNICILLFITCYYFIFLNKTINKNNC